MSDRHERLRLALRRLNVRQEDLAAVAGVSRSLVSRALSGETKSSRVFRAVVLILARREAK
jgi:transcriptional regulator with XRE-family HTH domain